MWNANHEQRKHVDVGGDCDKKEKVDEGRDKRQKRGWWKVKVEVTRDRCMSREMVKAWLIRFVLTFFIYTRVGLGYTCWHSVTQLNPCCCRVM